MYICEPPPRALLTHQPTNPLIRQPTYQPINQPTNHLVQLGFGRVRDNDSLQKGFHAKSYEFPREQHEEEEKRIARK